MKLRMQGWTLRASALTVVGAALVAVAPGCGSDSSSSGGGGTGGGVGGIGGGGTGGGGTGGGGTGGGGTGGGGTGGGGTGATGGGGTGATGGGGTGGSTGCPAPNTDCNGTCTNTQFDPANCGACGTACAASEFCSQGSCTSQCLGGTTECGGKCVDLQLDPANCGACGTACASGEVCSLGVCGVQCAGGSSKCGAECVDIQTNPAHCGGCGQACTTGQVCSSGTCLSQCPGTQTQCGSSCVDLQTDKNNCGTCGTACTGAGESCIAGVCAVCNSATTDCDSDGWNGTEGDCCDKPGLCGSNPALVNPGAFEVLGNGVDDNCNGLIDYFDKADTVKCDQGLVSNSAEPKDYAKALGICRETEETPANPKDKTWGLISAQIMKADGTSLAYANAKSIRDKFGNGIQTLEGNSMVVISSGIASDATQTNPGPNGGAPAGFNVSTSHSSSANLSTCSDPNCIKDWFAAANPPLKAANAFPAAPNCGGSGGGSVAQDSVMIKLRLRAPTNARAFSFSSYFFSAEYPEYVCTTFNDQYLVLVDTPGGTPSPIPNPVDKNLMTYTDLSTNSKWPIGINVASGTNLFAVCDPAVAQSGSPCYDNSVSPASCQLGVAELAGTGFEKPTSGSCVIGGGTYWLTTAGNVIPGQIVELRIVIFDVGDTAFDSSALVDGFGWLTNATLPGTG